MHTCPRCRKACFCTEVMKVEPDFDGRDCRCDCEEKPITDMVTNRTENTMARTTTEADKEAVRAAAIARVLTECFSEKERVELVSEALKPLFNDRPTPYGGIEVSVFTKAIAQALHDWTRKRVDEYCAQPDVKDRLTLLLKKECERIIVERVPQWVENMIKVTEW